MKKTIRIDMSPLPDPEEAGTYLATVRLRDFVLPVVLWLRYEPGKGWEDPGGLRRVIRWTAKRPE